jgi:hypothetical protein
MSVTTSLGTFLADCAGADSKSALVNIAAALQAWSILHNLKWSVNQKVVSTMLKGAAALAEDGCKRSRRRSVLPQHRGMFATNTDTLLLFERTSSLLWVPCYAQCVTAAESLSLPLTDAHASLLGGSSCV